MYRSTITSGQGILQCNELRMNVSCMSGSFVEYPTSLLCRLYMALQLIKKTEAGLEILQQTAGTPFG